MLRVGRFRRFGLLELPADSFSKLKSSESVRGGNTCGMLLPYGVDEMTELEHEWLVGRNGYLLDDAFLAVQRFLVVRKRAAVNRDLFAQEVGFDVRAVHDDFDDSHLVLGDP